jgi:hypothetical protein
MLVYLDTKDLIDLLEGRSPIGLELSRKPQFCLLAALLPRRQQLGRRAGLGYYCSDPTVAQFEADSPRW